MPVTILIRHYTGTIKNFCKRGGGLPRSKGDEELIARQGKAVAARWGAIPPYAQDQILNQAYEAEAGFKGGDIREALTAFLERDLRTEFPEE